uniref:Uncharacterized protein n=1 Tax=Hemiselmis andersenii TaxID=464988 RepID=A0A7S0UDB0_HEMAN
MPTMKQLVDDGRGDLRKLITKHGGMRVMAARLDLRLSRGRSDLVWGPFDLDFAIEVLEYAHMLALESDGGDGIRMPTAAELTSLGRNDVDEKVIEYGGYSEVARRLGMDT